MKSTGTILSVIVFLFAGFSDTTAQERVRDLGVAPGILTPGTWNAITDVEGVKVGHRTLIEGEDIRTGVTAVLPHSGNLFRDRVPPLYMLVTGLARHLVLHRYRNSESWKLPLCSPTHSVFLMPRTAWPTIC